MGKLMTTHESRQRDWHFANFDVDCRIALDGVFQIGTYFTKFIRESEEKGCLEASLRGRPLEGEILKLPEGYEAAVIQAVGSDGETFREVKRVKQLTYWNCDKVPSDSDQFKKAVQWLKIADVMHGGGGDEESSEKEESKENKESNEKEETKDD